MPPESASLTDKAKNEDKLVAQLAAELAAPLSVNSTPQAESQTALSLERLAMRQLQGRLRKNLLLKRPVQTSEEETPKEGTESPAAPEPVTNAASAEVSISTRKTPESAEIGLITKPESVDLKIGDRPGETILPVPEVTTAPSRQAIRIEKSVDVFTQLHTAIEYAIDKPGFQTDGLTDASLFQSKRPVVLGVTSAVAGEGKTTVALHLAMDIARNNFKKVCLIDMSLGEDTLSQRLEINTGVGLVQVLEGTHQTLPTIEAAEYEGLSIMPAGKTPENAARAARSPTLPEILNAGRKMFDVILVDMPSITSGNVLPIAPYVDAMVMVVYAGVTPKEVVADALERLDKNKVLGVVLNRVSSAMPSWLQKRLNRW